MKFRQIFNTSLVKQSFVYVVCDGINKAIPFLLLPFISYYLTPDDYGIVTNFNVYVQILSVFIYLCTAGALPVMYHKLDKSEIKSYVSNMIFINSIATIICIIVNLLIFRNIDIWLNINFRFQLFAVILVWFTSITNVNMILWRCEERPIAFGTYQISQSALNAITTIIFVISMLLGWEGRVYSMMCAAIIFGTISLFILHKRGYIDFKLQKKYIIQTVLFALPIIPHALSFWFRGGVEKILLSNMCGLSENGLYSVALTWGAVVTMFFTAFNNAYAPFLYKKLALFDKNKSGTLEQQKKLVRLIKICLLGTGAFVVVSYFISIIMIKAIYPQDYWTSINYLPWVMLAQFFQGCYLMFVCFTHYTFKTKQLGIITFSWSLIACALAWLGIKFWGAIGVSIASAIVSFAIFVSVAILAMKVYSLPWRQLLTLKL